MATFNISLPGCLLCSCEQAGNGNVILLYLDEVKYPGVVTNPVPATINSAAQASVYCAEENNVLPGYTYSVTVDDSDMPVSGGSPLSDLDLCDLVSWECEDCCTELDVRVTALEGVIGTGEIGNISAGDCDGFLTPTVRDYSVGDNLFFCTPDLSIITEVTVGGEIQISSGNRAVSATIAAGSNTVDLTYPVFTYNGVTTPGVYTVNTVRSISIQRVSGTEELGVNDYWDASGVLRVALRGSPTVADTHKIVVEFSLATVADQGQSGAP